MNKCGSTLKTIKKSAIAVQSRLVNTRTYVRKVGSEFGEGHFVVAFRGIATLFVMWQRRNLWSFSVNKIASDDFEIFVAFCRIMKGCDYVRLNDC